MKYKQCTYEFYLIPNIHAEMLTHAGYRNNSVYQCISRLYQLIFTVEPHYNGQLKNCNNLIIIVICEEILSADLEADEPFRKN
jgi:hypothetical protein